MGSKEQQKDTTNIVEAPKKPPRLKMAAEENNAPHLATAKAPSVKNQQSGKTKKRLQFHSPVKSTVQNPADVPTRTIRTSGPAARTTLSTANNMEDGVTDASVARKMPKQTKIKTTTKTTKQTNTKSKLASALCHGEDIVRESEGVCDKRPMALTPTSAPKLTPTPMQRPSIKKVRTTTGHSKTTAAVTKTTKTMTTTAVAVDEARFKFGEDIDEDVLNDGGAIGKSRLVRGCTSLMYACQHGDIAEVLAQLRSRPERIRQRDSHYKNALHYCAAQKAQTRDLVAAASIAVAAPELLESADEDGFTPLHLAVIQGNLAMVNLLLANKADVNAVDKEGHSVVHWATVCGEVEALRSVLAAGANIATPDLNGGTPLHYAAQMCGASVDNRLGQSHATKLALEILGILLSHPHSSVDVQDKDGRQPLLWAASAGSAKAVIALVKAGARVESADKDGLTALHCAASRGHTECIDTLISLCGAPTDLIDSNGCTALHYAVTLGHADATARLLDLDADPNRQDRKGRTPAHCGCSKGQIETVKLLKQRGANLWLRNAKGDLPVHEAASSGRRELVEWLLEQRPKQVNTTSNDGRSLLHTAAVNDYTDVCKTLLDYGGDVNAIYRNSKGVVLTPLDCALQKGYRSTAKFLQSHGGLPANKLRLAARRTNPFHDVGADMVRPLRYVEKEELHDLRNSKKYVVYLKHSDSEGGGVGEVDSNCSCSERIYRREQKFAHTCRRHQRSRCYTLRRRTSSCGEPKEILHKADGDVDICRSKSNIEIRRLKSRERYASSSEWEEGDDRYHDYEEDSCENCCYHKRQKQRVIRKRTISRRKSKERDERENGSKRDSSPEKRNVREVDVEYEQDEEEMLPQNENKSSEEQTNANGEAAVNVSRPHSSTKRATSTHGTPGKEGTFIIKGARRDEEVADMQSLEPDDEDGKLELVTTQVDVHRVEDADSIQQAESEETDLAEEVKNSKEEMNALVEAMVKEVDQVRKIAAIALESDSENGDNARKGNGNENENAETDEKAEHTKKVVELVDEELTTQAEPAAEDDVVIVKELVTKRGEQKQTIPNLTETAATPFPTPTPSASPASDNAEVEIPTTITSTTPIESTEFHTSTTAETATETASDATTAIAGDATKSTSETAEAQAVNAAEADKAEPTETSKAEESKTESAKEDIAKTESSKSETNTVASKAAEKETELVDGAKSQEPSEQDAVQAASTADTQKAEASVQQPREQESRRSFTLLPSDSAEDETVEEVERKSSFQILKSDDSTLEHRDEHEFSDTQVFKIVTESQKHLGKPQPETEATSSADDDHRIAGSASYKQHENHRDGSDDGIEQHEFSQSSAGLRNRHGVGSFEGPLPGNAVLGVYDFSNGRKRRVKKRVKSGTKTRSLWKSKADDENGNGNAPKSRSYAQAAQSSKDHDSGFEPSPRAMKSKIPTPRNIYTAPRRHIYATLDGRTCSSRLEGRKPGERGACDMSAVTRSIQRNIRRYYTERKIFQHLLELKSLQIRSTKLNEAVLVKRAVDDYHKSCAQLGGETGTRLRRYPFSDYTFKNFELFLYETLKTLQKPGTYNFQNINEVYEEAERRLSPDYNTYEKALQCTTKTHRCLHAAHAYTGIPCAAYIPMMNHHTMPKFGFGNYKKTGVGSFYLPKILTSGGSGCSGVSGSSACGGSKVALELSHGKSKQLISLPSDKLDSNKRYYVTFTVKESAGGGGTATGCVGDGRGAATVDQANSTDKQQSTSGCCGSNDTTGK